MPRRKVFSKAVTWLSEEIQDPKCLNSFFRHYTKFQFKNIVGEIGDYVLISNADAAEPDTEGGCDAACITALYEDTSNINDPFRAKVQWYSRPVDVPNWCFANSEPINFLEKEIIEDHRPFNTDVSIETFYKKCNVTLTFTKDINDNILPPFNYISRYRLMLLSRRKAYLEPVLEDERKALELLNTPVKAGKTPKSHTPKTPTSLVKRMSKVSLTEEKNWSVSKTDGTKLLLKKAILADKMEKESPKNSKSKKNNKKVLTPPKIIEENISMELRENSGDELPTLIIRQHVQSSPKRKQSVMNSNEEKSRKKLLLENDENVNSKKFERVSKNSATSRKTDLSPVKPSKKSTRKLTDSDEEPLTNTSKSPKKSRSTITPNISETPLKKSVLSEQNSPYATRSGRVIKKSINYMEYDLSPVKKAKTQMITESDDDFRPSPKTPKTPKTPRTPITSKITNKSKKKILFDDDDSSLSSNSENITKNYDNYMEVDMTPSKKNSKKAVRKIMDSEYDCKPGEKTPKTPKTPKSHKQSLSKKISELTPSLRARTIPVENVERFTKEEKSLPGRESHLEEILSFVTTKLLNSASGCMYISGVPGTGKTATVCAALKMLKEDVDLPDFHLVEVNGMKITEPRQAYVHIYKQLTGKTVVWEQASTLLEGRFTKPGPRRMPTVLLVDEMDALCTRRHGVLYSIMEWSTHATSLLTVLAIANTMDLPERVLALRVSSRVGLTRLMFPPYTHTQLQRIVASRLAGERLTPDAVQLIARKVASVSGDARRALALCTRALELAGPEGAGLKEVQQALDEAVSSATVRAIRSCCGAEKLILKAVAAEVEKTGSDETTFSRMLANAGAIICLDGRPYKSATQIRAPTPSQAMAICARLASKRLLLVEHKPAEPRILLNVSVDDVHYATRQINV